MKKLEDMTSEELYNLANEKRIQENRSFEVKTKQATLRYDLYWTSSNINVEYCDLFTKRELDGLFSRFKLCWEKGTIFYCFNTKYGIEWRPSCGNTGLVMSDKWAKEHLENVEDVK